MTILDNRMPFKSALALSAKKSVRTSLGVAFVHERFKVLLGIG